MWICSLFWIKAGLHFEILWQIAVPGLLNHTIHAFPTFSLSDIWELSDLKKFVTIQLLQQSFEVLNKS